MIRTQIYIPKTLHLKAKQIASKKGTSLAALMRESLETYLDQEKQETLLDALVKLQITEGPKDLSEHFDDYLYGNR